jgi:hypothetical protein
MLRLERKVDMTSLNTLSRISTVALLLITGFVSAPTVAQEVRYSYLDMSFIAQDIDEQGSQMPVLGQTVDYDSSDGAGIKFRGSLGTWRNMYLFLDYSSTDIDLTAFVVSPLIPQGQSVEDEYDLTMVRGGVGLRYPIGNATDLYGELSYESTDFDFGSFALEDFDTGDKDLGGALGIRRMMNDDWEVRAWARYTNVGDVDLNSFAFDADVLYGVAFGWQIVRGMSIIGDYESGEYSSWSIGFRLDIDEN